MSQLSVFRPADVTDGGPRILSFATYAARIKANQLFDVVSEPSSRMRTSAARPVAE
ncbi:MAG: hypothetical protein R3B90_11600 [Planctomycetaceae bacterium]